MTVTQKKQKSKEKKLNIVLSIVAVLTISAVGAVLLQMENVDESVIMIPETNYEDTVSEEAASQALLVNINTATKEELMLLSGIGEKKAEAIIAYREKALFQTTEDLMKVEGIGEKIYERIATRICVE